MPGARRFGRQVYRALHSDPRVDGLPPLNPTQRFTGFARFLFDRFMRARGLQVAGSLTMSTLLALVPLLTLALTVLGAFSSFRALLPRVREFLLGHLLPDTASRIIAGYMTHFSTNAAQLRLAGTLVLVLAALSAMMTVDRAFGEIWRVRARRPLARRLLTYWVLLSLGPLAIGIALTLSISLVKVALGLGAGLPGVSRLALRLIPWLAITSTLVAVYRWLPHRYVPMRHALLGGLYGGLAFELMKWLFGWYVHHFPGYTLVYGAFAAFPIFLLWIYLSWAVVLGGAVLTASLSYWHRDAWRVPRDHPDQRFRDALQILRLLMGAGERALGLVSLHRWLGLGYEDLELALEPLVQAGLVKPDAVGRWRAQALAWRSTVGDVWVLFHRGPLLDGQWLDGRWVELEGGASHWAGDRELHAVGDLLQRLPRDYLGVPLSGLVNPE